MRNLLYDKTNKKWLADIHKNSERQFNLANDKIVTTSTGKNGALVNATARIIRESCSTAMT
jgi:hypothetical protein